MARILIVDDDAAFRDSLAEMLQDLGYTVLQAETTDAGLHRLRTEDVDAAIVDLRLPGEDGLVFLRRAARISQVPCIMLTAYASGGNTIEAMSLGAFDHLTKPVTRAALIETLERALRRAAKTPDNPQAAGHHLPQKSPWMAPNWSAAARPCARSSSVSGWPRTPMPLR